MYHNFSIIISSLDNIKAIQNELHFSKSINLTTTLAAIPLTQYFMDKFEEINPEYEIIPELEYDNFEKYYFLIKYSSTPIVLYTISYKMGLGGRGDQSWLFKDGSLVSTYFDEKKSIGHVLNIALNFPAFPVDTHIHRLATRWGLSSGSSVKETEDKLKKIFARKNWNKLHLQIIFYGRKYCPARGHIKENCPICKKYAD